MIGGVGETDATASEPTARAMATVIEHAREAARIAATTNVAARQRNLRRLLDLARDRRKQLVDAIVRATGKSRTDALVSEVFPVLDHLEFLLHSGPKLLRRRSVPTPLPLFGKKSFVTFKPHGVVLILAPWNYPMVLSLVPATTAYFCGNAVVLKPSEFAEMRGVWETLLAEAGIAAPSVQIVYGDGRTGDALVGAAPDLVFFFTGSEATGRKVLARAAPLLVPVVLELGGKDAAIVFDDVDVERAAAGVLWGMATNSGQSCTSVERVLVHESVYDAFRDAIVRRARALVVREDEAEAGSRDLGTLIAPFQVAKVREHVADAKQVGARVLTGDEWDGVSAAVPPIVVENVPLDAALWREETFGSVVALRSFRDEDEAVRVANDSPYGLSASVWSRDRNRALRVARRLAVGNVSINNVMLTEGNAALPFGGRKQSGFGRYKGAWGIGTFTQPVSILIDADSRKQETNWFPYDRTKYRLFGELIDALFRRGVFVRIRFVVAGLKLERWSQKVGNVAASEGAR